MKQKHVGSNSRISGGGGILETVGPRRSSFKIANELGKIIGASAD